MATAKEDLAEFDSLLVEIKSIEEEIQASSSPLSLQETRSLELEHFEGPVSTTTIQQHEPELQQSKPEDSDPSNTTASKEYQQHQHQDVDIAAEGAKILRLLDRLRVANSILTTLRTAVVFSESATARIERMKELQLEAKASFDSDSDWKEWKPQAFFDSPSKWITELTLDSADSFEVRDLLAIKQQVPLFTESHILLAKLNTRRRELVARMRNQLQARHDQVQTQQPAVPPIQTSIARSSSCYPVSLLSSKFASPTLNYLVRPKDVSDGTPSRLFSCCFCGELQSDLPSDHEWRYVIRSFFH